MIITLPLIVVAATGALYIFKDEVEGVLHPGVLYVEPAVEHATYEQQLAAARAAVGPAYQIGTMQVFMNPKRATELAMGGQKFQFGYVDPYRGHYLGSVEKGGFSDIVLTLHRNLFLGTTGRIVVELTTCWGIVLVATGIYLWWPQKANQVWGVWLPRLRAKPYVVLRDLHTVVGFYIAVVAIVISLTGLIYTYVWGVGFRYAAQKTEAYDLIMKPRPSKSAPEAKDLSIDRIVQIAQQKMPGNNLSVSFPRVPNGAYMVYANNERGPGVNEILFIDRAVGRDPGGPLQQSAQDHVVVGDVELSAARRHDLGPADKNHLAGDLHHPHDTARDGRLDVVGASPDRPARPAPPRRRPPPPLASRHRHGDQYFSTRAGPLGGGGFGS
jgi:uncharacterized iron-regulated membrane protein